MCKIESPRVTSYLAAVLKACHICHHLRNIKNQNMPDIDLDL